MVSNLKQLLNVNIRYVLNASANIALQSARTNGKAAKLSNQPGKFQENIGNLNLLRDNKYSLGPHELIPVVCCRNIPSGYN